MHGTTARDWISCELTERELTPYFGPSEQELAEAGVNAVFLGYYFEWDPDMTRAIATANGFRAAPKARTGFYNYADVDDDFISIHHWLKWYKFGFTRLFDNLSIEIRNDRLTRDQAIAIIAATGEQRPDEDIAAFCRFTGIKVSEFEDTAEKFRNLDIWEKEDGVWKLKDFLIPDWEWA